MALPISQTKNFTSPQFDTYVPDLSDSANIQNALELFYYGNSTDGSTYDTVNSIYANLLDFDNRITANNISTHADATAAHGATGAVVGTTNIQTLTNKTLTLTDTEAGGPTTTNSSLEIIVSIAIRSLPPHLV